MAVSEDITQQLPQTSPLKPLDSAPAPSPQPKRSILGGVALVLGLLVVGGASYLFGTSQEASRAEETLAAITQSADEQNQTATAIVSAFTATPLPTHTPEPSATPEIPQASILPITANVQAYAGDRAPTIATLNQGTLVAIIGVTADGVWYQVQYSDSEGNLAEGFIPTNALRLEAGSLVEVAIAAYPTSTPSPIPTPTAPPSPTPYIPQARVLPILVAVHDGAGEDYAVIDTINQGIPVEIMGISEDGQWFEIAYTSTDTGLTEQGFVRVDVLQLTGGTIREVAIASYPTRTPVPSITPLPSPTPLPSEPIAMPAGQVLVVREGPAEVFASVGVIDANQTFTVTAVSLDGLWFQVVYVPSPTGLGWVSAQDVRILGVLDNLPIVQGPPVPEPTPISVVIEGGGTPVSNNPTQPPPSNGPLVITALPRNYSINFSNLPNLEEYAYQIEFNINGTGDGTPYSVYMNIQLARSLNPTRNLFRMEGQGELADFGDIAEFLPVAIGTTPTEGYVFSESQEFCVPATPEEIDANFLLEEFPALLDGNIQNITAELMDIGVFAIVDEVGLFGLGGKHYQFLGYADASAPNGYRPTSDMKIDLWFTEDERTLYAFSMSFNLGGDSAIPVSIVNEIDINFSNFANFEGVASVNYLPMAVGADSARFTVPPDACDYFID